MGIIIFFFQYKSCCIYILVHHLDLEVEPTNESTD
jgi:hypothetical protein